MRETDAPQPSPIRVKADLSLQKPLAASYSQNNFLSSHEYNNLMKMDIAGLSNRDSLIKLLRELYDLLNMPIFLSH